MAVVNSDSTGYIRIYDTLSYASYPSLSSNGSKLMFTSVGFEKSTLYITDIKKLSVPVKITETMPPWLSMLSEDGSKIIFSNYTNGTMQAYVTNLYGKNTIPLIDNSYFKPNPDCKTPSDEIECIGGPNMCPEQQQIIQEREDYQRLILVSAIGIPALAAAIGFIVWYKSSVRKSKGINQS
ncbi:MAG: PD40 domain-containing protein [Nitrosopumilales archaeon]|nr:PD40 domain-containing protein [Nitrosopumilales archaeon]